MASVLGSEIQRRRRWSRSTVARRFRARPEEQSVSNLEPDEFRQLLPSACESGADPEEIGRHENPGRAHGLDRIAQTVVKMMLEPILEPVFDEDSYGYRPGKSAHDAIAVTRKRCWRYDWVVEFDIRGLFDNIRHDMLMKAVRHHCNCPWVLLYIERWLTASLQEQNGSLRARDQGTPQGGVVSPILANLFLHYAFDAWVRREMPRVPFCRYADDGLLHCKSRRQAEYVMRAISERFRQCGLEIHPDKSCIVYCKDANRQGVFPRISFTFLGYTFRPRRCVDRKGRLHPNFLPAISRSAKKEINRQIRSWHHPAQEREDAVGSFADVQSDIAGWNAYYGRFYPSALRQLWRNFNKYLVSWVRRKFKKLSRHKAAGEAQPRPVCPCSSGPVRSLGAWCIPVWFE
jgi:RNA-directed DNA polymerase